MKMKMKNRSQRYNINRPRSRHGNKHSKYKKCLSIMMPTCIKQHPYATPKQHLKLVS